jgi:hypothetical protein
MCRNFKLQCRRSASSLARNVSFCMYLTSFSTDFLRLFCFLCNGVPYFCPCSLINGATSHHGDIFVLLPFLEHLVQPTLWCMVWPLLLSGWTRTQGSIIYYCNVHYSLYYIIEVMTKVHARCAIRLRKCARTNI